ncbi:hypothetical protein [Teredinibacter sp. KSP-S5-2]|uniref:hypothetical protein n=1 Tax=Teredinibacter sp. KSP-S5-2 TaxID=3034506 RepID=UPI002934187C|nr:hypothetical protein [Teredinibacter sp. KSP-S5-2]WNO10561.1 hypothetical protein P5V12_05180 [Teredinibacter sp. KSP-S5-2]
MKAIFYKKSLHDSTSLARLDSDARDALINWFMIFSGMMEDLHARACKVDLSDVEYLQGFDLDEYCIIANRESDNNISGTVWTGFLTFKNSSENMVYGRITCQIAS